MQSGSVGANYFRQLYSSFKHYSLFVSQHKQTSENKPLPGILPFFEGDVPFSDKEKTGRQIVPFFNSAVFL
jgi:hypothetical protein